MPRHDGDCRPALMTAYLVTAAALAFVAAMALGLV